jgi:hypothetical protein
MTADGSLNNKIYRHMGKHHPDMLVAMDPARHHFNLTSLQACKQLQGPKQYSGTRIENCKRFLGHNWKHSK